MSGQLGLPCVAVALVLLVAACATVPQEQLAREEAMWAAARQCQPQFTTILSIDRIDADGRLWYTCRETCPDGEAFVACYQQRFRAAHQSGTINLSSHVATASRNVGRTEIPVTFEGNAVFVPAFLNARTPRRSCSTPGRR